MKLFNETPKVEQIENKPEDKDENPSLLNDDTRKLLQTVDFTGLKLNNTVQKVIDKVQEENNADLDNPLGDLDDSGFSFKMTKYSDLPPNERAAVNQLLRSIMVESGEAGKALNPVNKALKKEIEESAAYMDSLFKNMQKKIKKEVTSDDTPQEEKVIAEEPPKKPIVKKTPSVPDEPVKEAEKDPEITEQDKQRFVLSVLNNEPYTETLNLFSDAIQITYQTLSPQMIDMLACALASVTEDTTIPPFLKTSFVSKYSTAVQVEYLVINHSEVVLPSIIPTNDFNSLSEQFLTRYQTLTKALNNVVVFAAINDNLTLFNKKCQFLSSKAFDENFWKPIQ
jgi:hypothetical protein